MPEIPTINQVRSVSPEVVEQPVARVSVNPLAGELLGLLGAAAGFAQLEGQRDAQVIEGRRADLEEQSLGARITAAREQTSLDQQTMELRLQNALNEKNAEHLDRMRSDERRAILGGTFDESGNQVPADPDNLITFARLKGEELAISDRPRLEQLIGENPNTQIPDLLQQILGENPHPNIQVQAQRSNSFLQYGERLHTRGIRAGMQKATADRKTTLVQVVVDDVGKRVADGQTVTKENISTRLSTFIDAMKRVDPTLPVEVVREQFYTTVRDALDAVDVEHALPILKAALAVAPAGIGRRILRPAIAGIESAQAQMRSVRKTEEVGQMGNLIAVISSSNDFESTVQNAKDALGDMLASGIHDPTVMAKLQTQLDTRVTKVKGEIRQYETATRVAERGGGLDLNRNGEGADRYLDEYRQRVGQGFARQLQGVEDESLVQQVLGGVESEVFAFSVRVFGGLTEQRRAALRSMAESADPAQRRQATDIYTAIRRENPIFADGVVAKEIGGGLAWVARRVQRIGDDSLGNLLQMVENSPPGLVAEAQGNLIVNTPTADQLKIAPQMTNVRKMLKDNFNPWGWAVIDIVPEPVIQDTMDLYTQGYLFAARDIPPAGSVEEVAKSRHESALAYVQGKIKREFSSVDIGHETYLIPDKWNLMVQGVADRMFRVWLFNNDLDAAALDAGIRLDFGSAKPGGNGFISVPVVGKNIQGELGMILWPTTEKAAKEADKANPKPSPRFRGFSGISFR